MGPVEREGHSSRSARSSVAVDERTNDSLSLGNRPGDRSQPSHTFEGGGIREPDAVTLVAEKTYKLGLHSAKTVLFQILCLHWKSASSILTFHLLYIG